MRINCIFQDSDRPDLAFTACSLARSMKAPKPKERRLGAAEARGPLLQGRAHRQLEVRAAECPGLNVGLLR